MFFGCPNAGGGGDVFTTGFPPFLLSDDVSIDILDVVSTSPNRFEFLVLDGKMVL